ncbi:BMC domain-containing protein [Anabaena sp. FACHB-1237]|uniref:carbon dioxide-concentrating mechanism protein CcmK n=1 Tax=Anabaena sp. FACHB-1237 TaxID=2692769 RepID=UPI0016808E94|nr:BMC domain-containing protein [Anabaena sp. FACHB-1237]MBD2139046.1 BMC domain-containing protein [Anabaena sp. FACHB-1237]
METYNQRALSTIHAPQRQNNFKDTALGLISTLSFPSIVGIADNMLKSAGVHLVGYEKIGSGHCTAIIRGGISDVRLAIETGIQTAKQYDQPASSLVIPRPYPNLDIVLPINRWHQHFHQSGHSRLSNQAIGLVETRGFPAMVGACDAMLKSADVHLASYEKIGAGLCTAIIRGTVSNVAVAVEAGMAEAERIGELNAAMIIPRPLEELEETLPVASCWVEESQPVNIPINIPVNIKEKITDVEAVELPDLAKLPVKIKEEIWRDE